MVLKAKVKEFRNLFPLMAIENGTILSKDADISFCWQVKLPELFTTTQEEYELIHSTWNKAIAVLPKFTVIHKQDWFFAERYQTKFRENSTFLSLASDRHFYERPYLAHECYLYVTKTTQKKINQDSLFSSLCRKTIIPKELNTETLSAFEEAVSQFESIVNDSGYLTLRRLTDDDLLGTDKQKGLIERYLTLGNSSVNVEDICLKPNEVRVGNDFLSLHTLSDTEDLPLRVSTDRRYDRLSTDRSTMNVSFAAPLGLLLDCNHIYNQYILIEDSDANLQQFEKKARNLHSLSRYSRANQINKEWIEQYLNTAHTKGLISVRAHFNIIAWSSNKEELHQRIKNDVGSALASMECKPHHNTIDVATLFWAGIPGNSAEVPSEETFYTFPEPAICMFTGETNYSDSLSPFGIKMVDRAGKPIHLDISDLPMKRGIITNRNKFILGPSGSGKSFFTNHMVRQYYEQGTHILLVDTGNSYEGLCNLIHKQTKGSDGIYYTYTDENPISFNPFYTDDYRFDVEKRESICTLLLTLWKSEEERVSKTEAGELGSSVNAYIDLIKKDRSIIPCFNSYYEFLKDVYRNELASREIKVTREDFNIDNLLTTLKQYYKGGRYDFLLNSKENIDLLNKRFIVFEIDAIKDNKDLFPVVTIIIMEAFINKMRRLKGVRKMILIEEAWKAIASANMADYIKYLYKTVRKYFGEAVVVTQEVDDIIQSPIVKESIINNSDCKILLDQRKYMNKFSIIQNLLGLTDKERGQILSINMNNDPKRNYKEVWIGLGGTHSAVYATEVSPEEYLTYTTEETEKVKVLKRAEILDGDVEGAIRQLAQEMRSKEA